MYLLNVLGRRQRREQEVALGIVMTQQIVPMLESISTLAGVCKDLADAMQTMTANTNELRQHLLGLQERIADLEEDDGRA